MRFVSITCIALAIHIVCLGPTLAQDSAPDAREISLFREWGEITKQIDFTKEYVLSIQWTGSKADDIFIVAFKGPIVAFRLKHVPNNINFYHNRLYALPLNTEWRAENDAAMLLKPTKVTSTKELATILPRPAPSGVPAAIESYGYGSEPIPDIAVPFGVRLSLPRNVPLKDADAKRIASRKNFTHLFIEGTNGHPELTPSAIKELAAAPNLGILALAFIGVTDTSMKELGNIKSLTSLDLIYTNVTEQGLRGLAPLKKLDTLRIEPAGEINDKTLRTLRDIGLLHALAGATGKADSRPQSADAVLEVKLNDTKITDAGLKDLTAFKNLRALDVGTMMRFYDQTEYLRTLYKVYGGGLTDAGLKELVHFKDLTSLGLRGTAVTSAGLRDLAPLETLTVLDLSDTKIDDAGLKELAACRGLTSLRLDGANITDTGLKELVQLKKLTTLDVRDTGVTSAGIAELGKASPNLVTLRFGTRRGDRQKTGPQK